MVVVLVPSCLITKYCSMVNSVASVCACSPAWSRFLVVFVGDAAGRSPHGFPGPPITIARAGRHSHRPPSSAGYPGSVAGVPDADVARGERPRSQHLFWPNQNKCWGANPESRATPGHGGARRAFRGRQPPTGTGPNRRELPAAIDLPRNPGILSRHGEVPSW